MTRWIGTDGYAEQASSLVGRYESISFEQAHAALLPLLPRPGPALDIGAGTGRDAAGLAALGWDVLAVEPIAEFRLPAARRHPSPRITWVEDSLPDLASVVVQGDRFALILATAVWMHLDRGERAAAMRVVASLVAPGGLLGLTLRRGPVPAGRRMFDVGSEETIELAEAQGLRRILNVDEASQGEANLAAGISWSRLVFARDDT